MIVGGRSQSIENRGRVRAPSSPIDVLSRHPEHVTIADLTSDLPALLAVLSGTTSLAKITRSIPGYDTYLRARLGLPSPSDWPYTTEFDARALTAIVADQGLAPHC
ncbi:hypothetical protein [Thermoactinospora rubra]|uniref:hypothetical protein n=1 Tax=Thermoactinospora rubra TaxID=1088767 RepID=UPI000A103EE1|nr:hypothetical protein [Thermoactinospora rubra]